MIYYVFFKNTNNVYLVEKFYNKNDFLDYYVKKRLQCMADNINYNMEYDMMSTPVKVPMFFKKAMLDFELGNGEKMTYYVMKLPKFCNRFFEKIFCSFIKL